mgnify:CR=1 FL=1
MAKVKSKTLVIIKNPDDNYSLRHFINTGRKKEEDYVKNIMDLDTSEGIFHAKDLLFNNWADKVFMIICPENIPDRVLLQPYHDLKIILLK